MADYDGAANVEDGTTESHMTGSEGAGLPKHVIAELKRRAAQQRPKEPEDYTVITGSFVPQPFEFPQNTQAEFQPTNGQALAAGLIGVSAYLASEPLIQRLTNEAELLYAARADNDDLDPELHHDEAVA